MIPCHCQSTVHDGDCPNHIVNRAANGEFDVKAEPKIYSQYNVEVAKAAGFMEGLQIGMRKVYDQFVYPDYGMADIRVCSECGKPDVHWSVSSFMRCRDCRNKDLHAKLKEHIDMLRWTAQTAHQAYHQDQPGTWEECPRDICASTKQHLT